MNLKLSDKSRQVLHAVHMDADSPIAGIAEALGIQKHTAHYQLGRLREENLIRVWPRFNISLLGYSLYEVLFSLAGERHVESEKVLDFLNKSGRVAWYSQLGGRYQYSMAICARDGLEVSNFLESLAAHFGDVFFKKSIVSILSYTTFSKDYLLEEGSSGSESEEWVTVEHRNERSSIDKTDALIIAGLYNNYTSNLELAKKLSLPRATLDYRIKRLREKGILLKKVYAVDSTKLGVRRFRFLISTRGFQKKLFKKMFEFCRKNPEIVNFYHSVGSWDFHLGVEVYSTTDVTRINQSLYNEFGNSLTEVETISTFGGGISENYLNFLSEEVLH